MEMESAGPTAKKTKLAPRDIYEAAPGPAPSEAADPKPTTAEIRSQENPAEVKGAGGEDSPDRISDLPDVILGEIISLLPTKDGARTQALASRWRHLWCAAPLNLDYRGYPEDEDGVLPGVILSAHEGPVHRLCLPARVLRYGAVLEAWRSPALDNLQQLEFYKGMRISPRCYQRPSSGSRPLSASPPSASAISRTIQSKLLGFPGSGNLQSWMSKSPSGVHSLRINSPTLRSIAIRWSFRELIIEDAPLLDRLLHLEKSMEMQIVVISAPKLETLGYISEWYCGSRVVFGSTVIQGLRIDNLTTVVTTVRILAIHMLNFNLDMVIGLMRFFPCLEELYMKGSRSGKKNLWRRKHLNFLRFHEIRLKTIVMGYYRGIQAQVNFATFLVLNARMLESIRLEVLPEKYNEAFLTEQHRMLEMEKRASRGARLCVCSHSVEDILDVTDWDLTDPFACGC
ncbi:unnamed protein product [Alopecurus aequalis]